MVHVSNATRVPFQVLERMIENFNILDFTLSKEEMDAIALLETGKSPIYDDMDLLTVKGIGLHKIHE